MSNLDREPINAERTTTLGRTPMWFLDASNEEVGDRSALTEEVSNTLVRLLN